LNLSETLRLTGSDRLLIIAPHPDDESIAAGGLLQIADAAGAAVRVLVLTDGDNNPWPQRWIEKRWRIDAAARARWGARRREEAEAALNLLGVARTDVRFLALPDMGITDILMRNDRDVMSVIRDEASSFAPTVLVAPSLADRHPDHSAAFILATRACADAGRTFSRILTFAVHGAAPQEGGVVVELGEAQRAAKYEAIRAHASQMRLSGKRFLKFAQTQESYRWSPLPAAMDEQIPLRATRNGESVVVRIEASAWRGPLGSYSLFVVAGQGDATMRRRVSLRIGESSLIDTVSNRQIGVADVRREQRHVIVTIPNVPERGEGYVKVARAKPVFWVFDRFGWQPIV
jgi:LmbE family N-acetylglucosaminyl deacetylase